MRRVLWVTSVLALITSAASGQVLDLPNVSAPDELDSEPLPTPEALINRYVEVTGGRAAHEGVRNRRVVATFRQSNNNDQNAVSQLTIHQSPPSNQRAELATPGGGERVFVVNGVESWTYDGDIVVASSGDQRAQEIRRAVFDLLLSWHEYFPLATTIGEERVGGQLAWKVRLTAEDCDKIFLFFDQETGLLVRQSQEILYAGNTVDSDSSLLDYREFDGVLMPTRTRRVLVFSGGRTVQEYEVLSVEHNVAMSDELFESPPELQPGE